MSDDRRKRMLEDPRKLEREEEEPTRRIDELFSRIGKGEFRTYLTYVSLSEVVYVAYRVYREAKVSDPNGKALKYVDWLVNLPGTEIVRPDIGITKTAGELRKRFKQPYQTSSS